MPLGTSARQSRNKEGVLLVLSRKWTIVPMVVSLAALFVALTGTGTAADVASHAKAATLRAGKTVGLVKRGPRGPRGPQGPAGIAHVTRGSGNAVTLCGSSVSCAIGTSTATCPSGSVVIGGGYKADGLVIVAYSQANTSTSYSAIGANLEAVFAPGTDSATLNAQAICASGPGATAALTRSAGSADSPATALAHLRAAMSNGDLLKQH